MVYPLFFTKQQRKKYQSPTITKERKDTQRDKPIEYLTKRVHYGNFSNI